MNWDFSGRTTCPSSGSMVTSRGSPHTSSRTSTATSCATASNQPGTTHATTKSGLPSKRLQDIARPRLAGVMRVDVKTCPRTHRCNPLAVLPGATQHL